MEESSLFEQNLHQQGDFRARNISHQLIQKVVDFIQIYKSKNIEANRGCFLDYVAEILRGTNTDITIKWFPSYNCALIARKNRGCTQVTMRNLFLLGLSSPDMQLQHQWTSKAIQTNVFSFFDVVPVKPVNDMEFEKFVSYCEMEFESLYCQDTKQRLGRHKKMSPAFIELVLEGAHRRLVAKEDDLIRDLKGGWSDASHHTGGEWPLLSAVIEYIAACSPYSYDSSAHIDHQHFVVQLQVDLLMNAKIETLSKVKDPKVKNGDVSECVNRLVIMMTCIARKAVDELAGIRGIEDIEKLLGQCRAELESQVHERFKAHSQNFWLENNLRTDRYFYIDIMSERKSSNEKNFGSILDLARSNISLLPIANPTSNAFSEVLELVKSWNQYQLTATFMQISMVLNTIENIFFELALCLESENFGGCIFTLESLVNEYRQWNRKFLEHSRRSSASKNATSSGLIVELLSNELLVMWIGFALVHSTLKKTVPLLQNYGIPLNWEDVSLLVVSKKSALTAAVQLAVYLRKNTKNGNEVFSLQNQDSLFDFALQFSYQSPDLLNIWDNEERAANQRENEQWQRILAKQKEVTELKRQLNDLQHQENNLKITSSFSCIGINPELRNVQTKISQVQSSLQIAENAPPPVFQPLPRNRNLGLIFLFFLHMPPDLKILARMAISAKQCLIPNSSFCQHTALDVAEINRINNSLKVNSSFWTSLANYYDSHLPSKASSNEVLHLFSAYSLAKPNHVGPRNVMDYTSPSQGVWHPDQLKPIILWNGGGFHLDSRNIGHFNPFVRLSELSIIEYFTEKVDEKIQFTITQYDKHSPATRSNEAIRSRKISLIA